MAEKNSKKRRVTVEKEPNIALERDTYSKMQLGEPFATYRKTILGKVNVKVLDNFTGKAIDTILEGNPRKNEDGCFVELWDEKEFMYFLRSNKRHLEDGTLIEYTKKRDTKIEKSYNNLSDEEIEELIVAPFFKLKKAVEEMTTEAALVRLIALAEEKDRPEGTMNLLRERLSLIQSGEDLNASDGGQ